MMMKGEKFPEKHGPGAASDDKISQKVMAHAKNDELPCAVAFKIAEELQKSPAEIGRTVDLLNLKLIKCQLGLFGYKPEKKIVKAAATQDPDLQKAIRAALKNDKLACRDAWEIALRFEVSKMAVSAVCEAMKIKIKPCQLGAF
jgi:hypothetical protein